MKKALFILAAIATLTGCAPQMVASNISVFHSPEFANAAQRSIIVVPVDDAQKSSLEFKTYAHEVETQLLAAGFTLAPNLKQADYAANINYGINNGKEILDSMPVYGQTGSTTSYSPYTNSVTSIPSYGITGYQTTSHTEYTRMFKLDIIDTRKSTPGNVVKIFEGHVQSVGGSASFSTVSRCLIQALFQNFPGENGKTYSISIPSQQCMQ